MKKRVVGVLVFLFLVMSVFSVNAQNESVGSGVDLAYKCLENKVQDRCDELSVEEKIFTVLATGKCAGELLDSSRDNECWPKSQCSVKTTAQSLLALSQTGTSTKKAEEWLLEKNDTLPDFIWFLEIDSKEETKCEIKYGKSRHNVVIKENKEISSGAGSCLSLSDDRIWLRVSPLCRDEEFEISCDKSFLTTLLFKQKDSPTITIFQSAKSASAEGTTTEKINAFCFSKDKQCDYEGTLWASLALKSQGYDISGYISYIDTMADKNPKLIPESFIYFLTGDINARNNLLLKQKDAYWDDSGNKFYDTAVALYPFQYEEPSEKSSSIEWLLEVQDKEGCWRGNIRDTAFILNSIWPKPKVPSEGTTLDDCVENEYYCMSEANCDGQILDSYSCAGIFMCCDTPMPTCAEQQGEICNPDENCVGGQITQASDIQSEERCCVGGRCELPAEKTECELAGGTCRAFGCNDGEKEEGYACRDDNVCCMKGEEKGISWFWIILLIILIILVILGLIFRNRLKPYSKKITSKFKKKPKPGLSQQQRRPYVPRRRRSMPVQQRRRAPPKTQSGGGGELDDVLKKLKEMGK